MANNVIGQVLGGKKAVFDGVETVAEVRSKLGLGSNYKATVDGDGADDGDVLDDGQFVSFTVQVKGA